MSPLLLLFLSVILILLIIIVVRIYSRKEGSNHHLADATRRVFKEELGGLYEEFRGSRTEMGSLSRLGREEMSKNLERLGKILESKHAGLSDRLNAQAKESREELSKSLTDFGKTFTGNVKEFNEFQNEKFKALTTNQEKLVSIAEEKLEKMRVTVDEKLHKTLEERLGQSFSAVSERLEAVQKGLGEMQVLAHDVGDLKRVLSGAKTRGMLGETQLQNILEQILTPDQYESNVITNPDSNFPVEFAIKLPGKDDLGRPVYLPIDAKFPLEDYNRLQEAYDSGRRELIEGSQKNLEHSIVRFAKDIRKKYVAPPYTTDFGIMFLPVEGLYSEVVRRSTLIERLQRECKVVVTGPTTLSALLNSLYMGFRTLAIEKRTSEVWQILGAVKAEFQKFGGVLEKARTNIGLADRDLDSLIGTRTRMIISKLKKIEQLPADEKKNLLEDGTGKGEAGQEVDA